jgi:hypothetical protein
MISKKPKRKKVWVSPLIKRISVNPVKYYKRGTLI